jgi:hypothetical protein
LKGWTFVASIFAIAMTTAAHAAEPRPWLCRDKPVFSSQQPMRYQLSTNSPSQWQLFLMQFTPGAGHDGFDITKSIRGTSSGQLSAGRYFAVALHSVGGNWVCPAEVSEQHTPAGTISNLCFAAQDGACSVKFIVTSDSATSTSPQPATP